MLGLAGAFPAADTQLCQAAVRAWQGQARNGWTWPQAGKDGKKYEWQSWPPDSLEGMTPKRRRLAGWVVVFWFLVLGGHLDSAFEAVGVPQPRRALLVTAVLAAVLVPLIRAAVLEARQLGAEGIELPYMSSPANR